MKFEDCMTHYKHGALSVVGLRKWFWLLLLPPYIVIIFVTALARKHEAENLFDFANCRQ